MLTSFHQILQKRLSWLLSGLVLLLLAATFHQALRHVEAIYRSYTLNTAADLGDQFQLSEVFLEAMRGQAEERLRSNPQSDLTRQLYKSLLISPDTGIALDEVPASLPAGLVGNLTGKGPLPQPGSEREAHLHLALSLSPLLATASKRLGREVKWVYFTGADNFVYLYPWRPSSQFRFHSGVYRYSYWQDALRDSNPNQQAIISRPYEDLSGSGVMISMSQPIVKNDKLIGMISLDIALDRLNQQLRDLAPDIGKFGLLNQHQQLLASSEPATAAEFPFLPTWTQYHWQQGNLLLQRPIADTPLYLVHQIALIPLLKAVLWQSAPALITLLFMLLAVLSSLRSRRLNQQLNYLSCHDALTGAFNRHYLVHQTELSSVPRQQPLGVIMFDCDHFKQVNDHCGHMVGDQVLIQLVSLCQQQLGTQDYLLRWGGEEFLLLVNNHDTTQLDQLAERLRQTIADYDWSTIHSALAVTISLGYDSPHPQTPLQEAIRRADVALYRAKTNGRNRSEQWQGDPLAHAE